jgi:hypothetical protein
MDFRRSGQLDGRRRRVLMDTSAPSDTDQEEARTTSGAKGPTRAYAPAVLDERQPKLTDLIPQRAFVLAMLALVGLTAIAAIEAVYIHLYQPRLGGVMLRGVDLAQRGSLAEWFSSVMLLTGAALSLVVYSIRLHRVDDYRGRYRVWLWTSAALVLASLATATGVHESLNAACAAVAGLNGGGASDFLWLAIYGTLFGGLGMWLAVELWPSLEAFSTLAVAAALYMLATVAQIGLLPLEGTLLSVVAGTTALMVAHGTLVYSLTLFARHVHLDAQGRLMVNVEPVKRKKTKSRAKLAVVGDDGAEPKRKKAASKAAVAAGGDSETKPAGASISAATLKSPAAGKQLSVAGDDEDSEDNDDSAKLSRAERRRLKKLAQDGDGGQQRRAA